MYKNKGRLSAKIFQMHQLQCAGVTKILLHSWRLKGHYTERKATQADRYKGAGIKVFELNARVDRDYLLHFEQPEVGVTPKLLGRGGSSGRSGARPTIKEAPTIIHSYSAMCDFVAKDPLLTPRIRTIYVRDDADASDGLQLHPGI